VDEGGEEDVIDAWGGEGGREEGRKGRVDGGRGRKRFLREGGREGGTCEDAMDPLHVGKARPEGREKVTAGGRSEEEDVDAGEEGRVYSLSKGGGRRGQGGREGGVG